MSSVLAAADVNARAIQREAEKARNAARNLAQAKSEKGAQQHLTRVEERLSNIVALAQSEVLTRGRMERGYGRGERRAQQQRVLEEKVQRLTAELEHAKDQVRAPCKRLDVLAAAVVDHLNLEMNHRDTEEFDEGDPRAWLYNLAHAVLERDSQDGERHLDELLLDARKDAEIEELLRVHRGWGAERRTAASCPGGREVAETGHA